MLICKSITFFKTNKFIEVILLFLMTAWISCTKHIANNKTINEDVIIDDDERYKKANLSSSIDEMNTDTEILNEITKKQARPDEDILGYVHDKLEPLHYVYNKRMQEIGPFTGTVKFEFKIISSGQIISIDTYDSSINDTVFIDQLKKRILNWNFGIIQTKNDTTTVKYPFVFSN